MIIMVTSLHKNLYPGVMKSIILIDLTYMLLIIIASQFVWLMLNIRIQEFTDIKHFSQYD